MHRPRTSFQRACALVLAGLACATAARADGGHGSTRLPLNATYVQECGACHVAFPPGLLPAASWQRVMSKLPRHYGTDASMDTAPAQALSTWLTANAGSGKRAREEPPEDRITRGAWFVREHREVSAATWTRPAVKSAANCVACHGGADKGDFNEHDVRIPR